MLAVLIEGSGSDALHFAACQRRLEHVARVDSPLGSPRADHGVKLVDEHDDLAGRLPNLVQDRLQPLLEFAPELAAGYQRSHVQRHHLLAFQRIRDILCGDLLGQPLGNGRLAHSRVSDDHRVVLGSAREYLCHPLDLLFPADDRVELSLVCHLCEVVSVLLQGAILAFGLTVGHTVTAAYLLQGLVDLLLGDT